MLLKTGKSILPIRGIYIGVLPLITIRLFAKYNPDGSTATNTNTQVVITINSASCVLYRSRFHSSFLPFFCLRI